MVDTILLVYAAIRESPDHQRAQRLLQEWGYATEHGRSRGRSSTNS